MKDTSIRTVGFVGYGAMGRLMGKNLRNAGFALTVYTPSGRTGDDEVQTCPSPKSLAESADLVVVCVPDDKSLFASAEGEDGFLAGCAPGTMIVNCSTVSPDATERLCRAARSHDLRFVDAPMSGSTPEAERGELVMLVGAEVADLEAARPVLDAIGKLTIHAGPVGAGTRLKLVVNGIMGGTLAIIAEAVGYGLGSGLDRTVLYDALSELAVISPHHKRKLAAAARHDFSPQFPARLMSKDMGLLVSAVRQTHGFCPAIAVADQALSLLVKRHANDDYASLLGAVEKSVVHTPPATPDHEG
ncbi:3-hydroxyisobutyrate dehydrogenase [Swaminathania salitolerans LMG 21291]|uniref:3-hydroxyisobutyrate dehydrogenase n=2 Tax=Swaminathania salitolerans TaxID=182838 RepID=A0A511BNI2_9PROT|nr:3-hydroxyisobutyrate dehydrogenase [Swaminathania salitolerans LMG 21291]GEL01413.1 3-hydroxyisobutyrate dehydrogenase [Swaminathania salitolerans]